MSQYYFRYDITGDASINPVISPVVTDVYSKKDLENFKSLYKRVKNSFEKNEDIEVPYIFEQTIATHFGYVNNNNTMYPVEYANKSARSWTMPFRKPVLVNHDRNSPPLGRHYYAIYKPSDTLIPSKINDIKTPKGAILTHSYISDKDAIDKVMDGRFLTVSISGSTPEMKCSICDSLIFECDHYPGEIYDRQLCYKKTRELDYIERSFVNQPADQSKNHYAGVTNFELIIPDGENIADSMEMDYIKKNMLYSKEDKIITDSSGYTLFLANDQNCDLITGKPMYYFGIGNDEKLTQENEKIQDDINIEPDADDNDNSELDYWLELDRRVSDYIEKHYKEHLLTPKDRSNLKSGSFCGPNRTLPIVDEKYYNISLNILKDADFIDNEKMIYQFAHRIVKRAKKMGFSSDQSFDSKISTINKIVDSADLPSQTDAKLKDSNNFKSKSIANNIRKEQMMPTVIDWNDVSIPSALDNVVGLKQHVDKIVEDRAVEIQKESLEKASDAEKKYESMKTQYDELLDTQTKLVETSKELTIDNILGIYSQLKTKSYLDAIKNEDGEQKLRDKLRNRTLDSLQDALNDLKDELNAIASDKGTSDEDLQSNSDKIKSKVTADAVVEDNSNDEDEDGDEDAEDSKQKHPRIIGLK